jgi:hypothetical protein
MLLGGVLILSGCLPSSCRRIESRAISSADSLSRAVAAEFVPDTLVLRAKSTGTDDAPLEYVRSLVYGSDGLLYAADAAADALYIIDETGSVTRTVESELFSYPYVAGAESDSVIIFSPGRGRMQLLFGDEVKDVASLPADLPDRSLLQYAHRMDGVSYVKLLGDGFEGYVGAVQADGSIRRIADLSGPAWRRAGFLRSWGEMLISLNGYRPVIDIVRPDGALDSLRLRGFDSPMLSRLRLFELGEIDAPPLLSAAASALGDSLFVLNMRPGWLQVDVYDRSGELRAILTQPEPGFNRDYYPTDIAVTRSPAAESIRIAVSVVRPDSRVDLYDWVPQRPLP